MRLAVAALALALALAACASGPNPRDRYARLLTPTANPSKVVAAELAFARAAQEKGQWTAFRQFATDDAVMFVPAAVNAREWLGKQADPAQAVRWQPHEVWSSCDGSMAVTRGAWQRPDGSFGYFTTVWQAQRNGDYAWVLDQGEPLSTPLAEPELIKTHVAQCGGAGLRGAPPVERGATRGRGSARDGTLDYRWEVAPDLGRTLVVRMQGDAGLVDALTVTVPAPTS